MEDFMAPYFWAFILALPAALAAIVCTIGVTRLARRHLVRLPVAVHVVVTLAAGVVLFFILLVGGVFLALCL
ncbi:MAG TPA: hypothetical protein VIQ54_29765 [Polyangia bacterium]